MERARKARGGISVASRPRSTAHAIRLKAPAGCTAVSLGGREYKVIDGIIEMPRNLAAHLLDSHGFTLADE
ncbi:MAG TPA: hypothetical protein VFC38_07045 [Stellaceae bacterium]|nr:hypothetical protein [Stellaceae bacterium]